MLAADVLRNGMEVGSAGQFAECVLLLGIAFLEGPMKNNLLNSDAKTAMMARIAKLQPGMPALWGKMNVAQVL
jgi:hypothetical protein